MKTLGLKGVFQMKSKITSQIYTFIFLIYTSTPTVLHFLTSNFTVIWNTLPIHFKVVMK